MAKIDFDPDHACKNLFIREQIAKQDDPKKGAGESSSNERKEKNTDKKDEEKDIVKTHPKAETEEKVMQVIYLPKSLTKRIKMHSILSGKRRDRTISSLVESAVNHYLKRNEIQERPV